ncbi:MAG: TVP38/TMEM64 family protein [Rhodospirillales bacterium]|nr:TVP38/TMEM64 family protein [Rhodospirillales bacterium]
MAFIGSFEFISSPDVIRAAVEDAGAVGPLIIVVSIAIAVVISPLPSAPLTAISGAAYGHIWGTVYALIGAQIGAMIAFFIARKLGRVPVGRMASKFDLPKGLSSPNTLTISIFLARLVPAISFDAVSYVAGVTAISTLRFSLATLAGMIPMTFLFSHMGGQFALGDSGTAGWLTFLAAFSAVILGIVWATIRQKGKLGKNRVEERKGKKHDGHR